MYGADSSGKKIMVLDDSELESKINTGYKVDFLVFNPANEHMYAIGNQQEKDKLDFTNHGSTSSDNTLASGGLQQPFAQIQQFNQDTGPICCDIIGSKTDQSIDTGSYGQPMNGKITIINGTEKIHSTVFNNPIESVAFNPNDKFLYLLTNDPGKITTINDTEIVDSEEIGGNPKKILFNPGNGLTYVTKEKNYEYSIDVFENLVLKNNIPIKYLYDRITINPSNGLIYILEGDMVYIIDGDLVIGKILLNV